MGGLGDLLLRVHMIILFKTTIFIILEEVVVLWEGYNWKVCCLIWGEFIRWAYRIERWSIRIK